MAASDIVDQLENKITFENMSECFREGNYEFDFDLETIIASTGTRSRSFPCGNGKNRATLNLTINPAAVNGKFTRHSGAGPENDRNDENKFKFNDNFFDCIEQATAWVRTIIHEEVTVQEVIQYVPTVVSTFNH